jgi:hypothetical protein
VSSSMLALQLELSALALKGDPGQGKGVPSLC